MLSINTDPGTLAAHRHLARAQSGVETHAARLASGQRINGAADDAAGAAIAARMSADVRGTSALQRGLVDAISLVQVAQAGLSQVNARLQRALEIAVQAANATPGSGDRAALERDWVAQLAEIDRIADGTRLFGFRPLVGAPIVASDTPHITDLFPASGVTLPSLPSGIRPIAYIPAGATSVRIDIDSFGADDDIQVMTVDGRHLVGTSLGDATWTRNGIAVAADMPGRLFLPGTGFRASASYDGTSLLDGRVGGYAVPPADGAAVGRSGEYGGMRFVFSGDGDHADGSTNSGSVSGGFTRERLTIDRTTEALLVVVTGSGVFSATASWGDMPAKDAALADHRPLPIDVPVAPAGAGGGAAAVVTIEETPADTATLGLLAGALASADSARDALAAVGRAIELVSGYSTRYGAIEARLDASVDTLLAERDATSAAHERIVGVDHAAESAALVRERLLSDAAQSILAQANANRPAALDLLERTVKG